MKLDDLRILYCSVYYHHHRTSVECFDDDDLIDQTCEEPEKYRDVFIYDKFNYPEKIGYDSYLSDIETIYEDSESNKKYIFLKGMLNKLDYAASAYTHVEIKNDYLENSLDKFIINLSNKLKKQGKKETNWNDLQRYMIDNRNENVVVVAQTGMGKTEAGLLWIGNNKGFFTLPIRTAINSIYNRIKDDILEGENINHRLGLLHGETLEEISKNKELLENNTLDDYYTLTRQLSLPLTVCTLDQLFTFVFKYKNFESKLVTLSYSKIVIDEVQMYSPELIGYLLYGLKMIQDFGGKFAILTATLPGFLKKMMIDKGLLFKIPNQEFVDNKIRHSVSWIREKLNAEFIYDKFRNNKILVICNTVNKCQEIYTNLSNIIKESNQKIELNMLHAKYIKRDRDKKTRDILDFGKLYNDDGRLNKQAGIWVTSSIAEASLDMDFDILITELSDVTGLFQRMGRCYRKREWVGDGYNCYVFDGGENICSGVCNVIDKDVYELSKTNLRKYFENQSSKLDEFTKMKLVREILSFEQVKKTKYYKKIENCFNYPDVYFQGENSKEKAQKLFRNIDSKLIIPKSIYDYNILEINNNLNIIHNKKSTHLERMNAKLNIKAFTMSLETHLIKFNRKEIVLNSYETIYVIDCDYDDALGYRKKEDELSNKDDIF